VPRRVAKIHVSLAVMQFVPALDKTCAAPMSSTHSKETAKISILVQARSESNTQTELFTTSSDFLAPGTAQMLLL
jgi:hypothetical protein